jgi:hypothetical protein
MRDPAIEAFGRALVRLVRDEAVRSGDRALAGSGASPRTRAWREAVVDRGCADAVHRVIPDIVDLTLFHLLEAVDNGRLSLSYRSGEAEPVDLTDAGLGELAGWFLGMDGWREQFSDERYESYSAGLRLDTDGPTGGAD